MSNPESKRTFRNSLEKISAEYSSSLKTDFTNHELANFIRQQFPDILRINSNIPDNYKLVGSPGKGNRS